MRRKKNIISEIFKGDFLSRKDNQQHLLFIVFVVGLIIINITLYYNAENLAWNISKAEKELYELRVEYITTKSELMKKYKRSNIEQLVKNMELGSSLIPPKIIEKNQ